MGLFDFFRKRKKDPKGAKVEPAKFKFSTGGHEKTKGPPPKPKEKGGGLFGFFRRRKKESQRKSLEILGGGHRGVAIGSLKEPDYSKENVAKWKGYTADEVEGFVYDQQPFFVHSTNVVMAQYFIQTKQMMVEYKDSRAYLYDNVSEDEAINFAKAESKGVWVWDNLRVRGSKTAHKKSYTRIK